MTPLNAKLAFFSLTWKSTVTQWGSCKHKSVIGLISKLLLLTNGQLGRALILVSLALYLQSTSVSLVLLMLRILNSFLLHFLHYLLVSWAWRDWLLAWMTSHSPSFLWYCWLGHLTRKVVPEMTCNVLSVTLNPAIHTLHTVTRWQCCVGWCCSMKCVLTSTSLKVVRASLVTSCLAPDQTVRHRPPRRLILEPICQRSRRVFVRVLPRSQADSPRLLVE